jgi:hypothetical protein
MPPAKKNVCPLCRKQFSRSDALKRHQNSIHGDVDVESHSSNSPPPPSPRDSTTSENEEEVTLPKYIIRQIVEVLSTYLDWHWHWHCLMFLLLYILAIVKTLITNKYVRCVIMSLNFIHIPSISKHTNANIASNHHHRKEKVDRMICTQ